jgi:ketosteroid isomerase-like protein
MTTDDLAARAEIQHLIARYAVAIDARDFDAVSACFAEGARATYGGVESPPGRHAIADWLKANFTAVASTHLLAPPLIELHGDRAQTVTPAIAVLIEEREGQLVTRTRGLRYSDELERGAEGWKIVHRLHEAFWEAQQPAQPRLVPPHSV